MGSPRAGSNPAHCDFFFLLFTINKFSGFLFFPPYSFIQSSFFDTLLVGSFKKFGLNHKNISLYLHHGFKLNKVSLSS